MIKYKQEMGTTGNGDRFIFNRKWGQIYFRTTTRGRQSMENQKYIHQFKTMDDLRSIIKEFEGALARPTRNLSHPTLYRRRDGRSQGYLAIHGPKLK